MTAEHLENLNPEQHRAVTTLEGPLLILAGAGSGKTRVLTRRIAHLLHEGVEPGHILAVTFTNKAAAEMKERVAELVGEAGRKVWISTFHSSCARILRMDIEPLGWTKRFAIYDDDDQRRILKQIVKDQGWDEEKHSVRKLLGRIDHYKNRMMGPDELLGQQRTHLNDPLLRVWREYDTHLRAADALDFNDLIGLTVRLFREHPEVLAKWQERFRFLLVDEYQDTNQGQYRLLRLLAEPQRNLAVVGDDDQSIYGFRGADISNILGFEADFPDAAVIRLEQNYRSTRNILQVANHVIAQNTQRKDKALWTSTGEGRKVRLVQKATAQAEADWVASAVYALRRQGLAYSDIAIVYRTNATSRLFERALSRRRIPHRIVGGRKFYERREVRDILGYLRLVVNPADDAAFLRIVNVPSRGIGAKTVARLRDEAASRGEPLLQAARSASTGTGKAQRALRHFVELIDTLAEESRTREPTEIVHAVIERSGYRAMLEADEKRESKDRMENLQELLRDAHQHEPGPEATTAGDRLRGWLDRIALAGQDEEIPEGGEVTLMTVHNAKGLEYPVVFVVHVMEGQFPHTRSAEEPGGVEEERRLAYVAFTRARQLLIISYNSEGTGLDLLTRRRRPAGPAAPSRFLASLPEAACDGDLPTIAPALAGDPTDDDAVFDHKLRTFVENHRTRGSAPGAHRLVEIDDLEQLEEGRRIHHARYGFGVVQGLRGQGPGLRLLVDFGDLQPRSVALRGAPLHLVEE